MQINQSQYVFELMEKFNVTGYSKVPADPKIVLSKFMCPTTPEERKEMENIPYIEAIGSLLYAAINSRPDISFQVSELGKYCANPGKQHWEAVKKLMQYLNFTPNHGITFGVPHDTTIPQSNSQNSENQSNNTKSLPSNFSSKILTDELTDDNRLPITTTTTTFVDDVLTDDVLTLNQQPTDNSRKISSSVCVEKHKHKNNRKHNVNNQSPTTTTTTTIVNDVLTDDVLTLNQQPTDNSRKISSSVCVEKHKHKNNRKHINKIANTQPLNDDNEQHSSSVCVKKHKHNNRRRNDNRRNNKNIITTTTQNIDDHCHYVQNCQKKSSSNACHVIKSLHAMVDSNFGRDVDTRRSRTGATIFLNYGPILWKSSMQHTVALSSMESEYIGGSEITRNIFWLDQALTELGFRDASLNLTNFSLGLIGQSKSNKPLNPTKQANNPKPLNPTKQASPRVKVYMDNKSAITFASEPMVQQRSRHVDIKCHYIREKLDANLIELIFLPTAQMVADILTKPLTPPPFTKFRKALGVHPIEGLEGSVEL
jgi:hypothetical protein